MSSAVRQALGVTAGGTTFADSNRVESRQRQLDALETRSRLFAVAVIRICRRLAMIPVVGDMARQLGRAANSFAVNHRAVRRARSMKEFAAKLQIVNEEIDESVHWLEVLSEADVGGLVDLSDVTREARELRAMFATARKTTRARLNR